jgi:hypothetical protein
MDFHQLTAALKPLGFRRTSILGPLELASADFGWRVEWSGPGQAVVEVGVREVFKGTFSEVATWLKNRSTQQPAK